MIYENSYACNPRMPLRSVYAVHVQIPLAYVKSCFSLLSYNELKVINRQKTFKVPLIKQERTSWCAYCFVVFGQCCAYCIYTYIFKIIS